MFCSAQVSDRAVSSDLETYGRSKWHGQGAESDETPHAFRPWQTGHNQFGGVFVAFLSKCLYLARFRHYLRHFDHQNWHFWHPKPSKRHKSRGRKHFSWVARHFS